LFSKALSEEVEGKLVRLVRKFHQPQIHYDTSMASMVQRPVTVESQSETCEEIDRMFRANLNMDHRVVVVGKKPEAS
jgi:hypothetical protein